MVIEPAQPPSGDRPAVPGGHRGATAAELGLQQRVTADLCRKLGICLGVTVFYQVARFAMIHEGREAAYSCGHDRGTACRRLQGNKAEGLRPARDQATVGHAVIGRQQLVGLRRHEAHAIGEAVALYQSVQDRDLRVTPRAARATDHHQLCVRDGLGQQGEGSYGYVGTFQGLDAPNEQQHWAVAA